LKSIYYLCIIWKFNLSKSCNSHFNYKIFVKREIFFRIMNLSMIPLLYAISSLCYFFYLLSSHICRNLSPAMLKSIIGVKRRRSSRTSALRSRQYSFRAPNLILWHKGDPTSVDINFNYRRIMDIGRRSYEKRLNVTVLTKVDRLDILSIANS